MSLKERGFRFCISPDKKLGRWVDPAEYKAFYSDWVDHTDTPEKQFIEFLQSPVDVSSESQ